VDTGSGDSFIGYGKQQWMKLGELPLYDLLIFFFTIINVKVISCGIVLVAYKPASAALW
jgi:hypothetical protein